MAKIEVIGKDTWEDQVVKSSEPVLVDFYADWCGPCRALAPKLEEISGKYAGKARVVKVNVDENRELAGQFGVRGIPALYFFKDGEVKEQLTGNQPQEQIENVLKTLI